MPTPHNPRVCRVLEAVATSMAKYNPKSPDIDRVLDYHDLLTTVCAVFPDADALRAFIAAGVRTAEDARTDPQPGDTFTDARGDVYTVAVRYKTYVVYDGPESVTLACGTAAWGEFRGTFTPAP